MPFAPATKEKSKLRMAIMGPAKSGKTYTALKLATALAGPEGRIAVIDTEAGSASKYAGKSGFKFDCQELATFHPGKYVGAIQEAEDAGYDVIIVDSLTHEWDGPGGCLETVDKITKEARTGNSFTAWGDVTPYHNALIAKITSCKAHIICTFRVKMEYRLEDYTDKNGLKKSKPVKMGIGPITRQGMEYEFDILMDMHLGVGYIDHTSRCPDLQHVVAEHPGDELAGRIKAWLEDGDVPALEGGPAKTESITKVAAPPKPAQAKDTPRPEVPKPPSLPPGVHNIKPSASSTPPSVPASKPNTISATGAGNAAGKGNTVATNAATQSPPPTANAPATANANGHELAGFKGLQKVLAAAAARGWVAKVNGQPDRAKASGKILELFPDLKGKDILKVLTVAQAEQAADWFDKNPI